MICRLLPFCLEGLYCSSCRPITAAADCVSLASVSPSVFLLSGENIMTDPTGSPWEMIGVTT